MKIIQLLPTLAYGDAVGNDALALKKLIAGMGYDTAVYAENIDRKLPHGTAFPLHSMQKLKKEDVLIYHFAIGCDLNERLKDFHCRKIMIYHNITPCDFFIPYNMTTYHLTQTGREQLARLKDQFNYCFAVSQFNKEDLLNIGFSCPVEVLPILIPFENYKEQPDENVLNTYHDGWTNILFVGRVAPNKKQEDVIRAFYYYKTHLNPKSRLLLVGSWTGMESYYQRLCDYVEKLGLKDVVFSGHVKFSELLAYYRVADAFLCMSEHEGFCVPLVEAMYFNVPIFAYAGSAIPGTLGGSGVLFREKDPALAAKLLERVLNDPALKEQIVRGQKERLKDFSYETVSGQFLRLLKNFLEAGK